MASELIVQTLKGPTSGANANKVIIPSGQTLDIDAWTPPAGTVLQVVQGTKDSNTNSTSSTFASTGLTATITPASASNKILVVVSLPMYLETQSNSDAFGHIRVVRGSTDITGDIRAMGGRAAQGLNTYTINNSVASTEYLDSPNTTSATTYTVQHKSTRTTDSTVLVSFSNNSPGFITLMEIAG